MKNYKIGILITVTVSVLLATGFCLYVISERGDLRSAVAELRATHLIKLENPTSAVQSDQLAQANPASRHSNRAKVALTGTVPGALARATKIRDLKESDESLTLTLVLKRADQQAFDDFRRSVQDPQSPGYQKYLAPEQQADRFGPHRQPYDEISSWLKDEGFTLIDGSRNRLTITFRGTRAQAERTFDIRLNDYRLEQRNFYSNDREPRLPAGIAANVQAVIGLNNLAAPVHVRPTDIVLPPQYDPKGNLAFSCWYAAQLLEVGKPRPFVIGGLTGYFCMAQQLNMLNLLASGTPPHVDSPLSSKPNDRPVAPGSGQKIGLLQFDNFNPSDVKDFLNLIGRGSQFSQLSQVHVAGGAGAPGADESEVLLDVAAVMSLAPGAQVVVYDGPFNGRGSFQTMFNAMISDGVNVISNSWAYCEDQTTLADVQSIDTILASAGAAGITVLTGSGDTGSTCLNGSANTCNVPAGSPNITAVGGTTTTRNVGGNYGSETWWNSPLGGQGGFGVSRFFSRPSYQNGLTNSEKRSVPDVTAPADPLTGYFICQASNGGCPTNLLYGGTSVAAPIWAAFVAVMNQKQNQALGFLNPRLYPLANTNAFHSATQLGSDFQHVGLGSPNVNLLHLALSGSAAGAFSVDKSTLAAYPTSVVADGQAQAGVVVSLVDANGNSVSGQAVQLTMNAGSHAVITPLNSVTNVSNGAALFTVTDTFLETVTFTATVNGIPLSQHPTVQFVSRPAAAGGISASPTTVNANGLDTTTITVTLQDSNGNPSPGKLVNLFQGNGSSSISTTSAVTNASGVVQFTAFNNITQTVTYTAVDVTDGNLPVPGSAIVNWVNASGFCSNSNSYRFGTAAAGYAVTTFASSFPLDCFTGIGPIGLVFDSSGNLLVGDAQNNNLYKFGPQGGIAGPATLLANVPPTFGVSLAGLTFAKDGRLYAMLANGNNIVELNPTTGAVIRTVVHISGGSHFALAIDPLSGDLFASGFDGIERISNYANGPGTITHYTSGDFDGIVFAADGAMYAAAELQGAIYRINGTNSATPGAGTLLVFIPGGPDGMALEPNPSNPAKPILYVNRNDGTITRIDTNTLPAPAPNPCGSSCTDIYTGGSRGDFVTVSPGGCLYATQSERIIKITKADGACSLLSDSSAPQLLLTPENVQPSPVQGTTVTFTATLKNVASPANIPVTLFVNGANQGLHLINTDSTGKSVFTYTGIATGNDRVSASADLGTSTISSNEATVNWTAGKHTSFLSLNQSPTSSVPNQSILLTANLVDVSVTPPVPLSGASVTLMLASQSCLATTNGAGVASCSIAPALAAGKYTLNATFAGTGALLGSSANQGFEILQSLPAVQFSAAAYSVNEGGGSVAITVTRTGDTASPATVDYRTTDVDTFTVNCAAKNGAAFARCDFATVVGSVSFAGGETSKSFNVPIIDDAYGEGPETFSLVLSNPTSATLGVPLTTTVTINDNETVDGPNPILQTNSSGVNFFVRQHYLDFLGREPEVGEPWSAILNGCADQFNTNPASPSAGCDRITVSGSFFGSPEFKDKGLYIIGMYRVAFNRLPTYVEFSIDLASITGTDADVFAKRAAYAGNFVQRSEFTNIYAAMTNTQFVNALMSGAQGQNYNLTSITTRDPANPDTGAKITLTTAELINRLTAGTMTRGQVLRAIAQSDEIAQIREAVNAFVASQYYGYLRRTPETAGFNSWVNHLTANPNDFRTMVHGFLNSTEYRSRFGPL